MERLQEVLEINLSNSQIGNGHPLDGEVDKDFFSGPIFLPSSVVQFLGPMAIEVAELRKAEGRSE